MVHSFKYLGGRDWQISEFQDSQGYSEKLCPEKKKKKTKANTHTHTHSTRLVKMSHTYGALGSVWGRSEELKLRDAPKC